MTALVIACLVALVGGVVALRLTAPVPPSPLKHVVDGAARVFCIVGAVGLVLLALLAAFRWAVSRG